MNQFQSFFGGSSSNEVNEPLLGGSSSPAGVNSNNNNNNNSSTLWTQFSDSISDYVPLRSGQRSNDQEAYLALSHWERFLAFLVCQAGAAFCFLIAFLTLPMLAIKPRKFAVAFSMGSLLFMLGFSLLQGPVAHFRHLFSSQRWPFTVVFVGSLFLTLYSALIRRSYVLTLIFCIAQTCSLVFYLMAYFPGGTQTLRLGGRVIGRSVAGRLAS